MNITGTTFDESTELLEAPHEETTLVKALLSVMSRHLLPDVLAKVSPADFADPHFGLMWESARQLHREGTSISKRTLLAQRDTDPIRHRLKLLAGEPVTDSAVHAAAASLVEIAQRRHLLDALKRAATHLTGAGSYSEALHFASEQISGLSEGSTPDEVRSFADAVTTWREWMAAPRESVRTIPTPWTDVNDALAGGLHPGRTYVWGGRPGEGKSIALLNVAGYCAEKGHPALIFSVEMGETEVTSRVIASGARAHYGQITKRNVDDHNRPLVDEYIDSNIDMPLMLVDRPDITVEGIASVCRTVKRTQGLDVVVVDYLQLLKASDLRKPREQQVAQISRSLKLLSRELECAVIIACQLNRNAANQDRKPALSELRESGSIEQDADVVILLHHPKDGNNGPSGVVELVVAKNRTGPLTTITLPWRSHQARIG